MTKKKMPLEMEFFFEHSNDMLCIVDIEGRFRELNPKWENILGYRNTEMKGMAIVDFIYPDDIEETNHNIQTIINQHKESIFTNRFRYKDGSYHQLEWTVFFNEDKIFAFVNHITKTGEIESNPAFDNNYLYKISLDYSNDAVYWLNRDAKFEYVNIQACKVLGYTEEELMQLSIFDIDTQITKKDWYKSWDDLGITSRRKEGTSFLMETFHKRKDGTIYPVEVSIKHLWIENKEFHIAQIRDITDRKTNEDYLKRFKLSIDYGINAVYWINKHGKFDYVNKRACEMLGYTEEELLKLDLFTIDTNSSKKYFRSVWEQFKKYKQADNTVSIHKRKDGTLIPVEIISNRIEVMGKDTNIVYVSDISERKQNEDFLNKFKISIDNTIDAVFWINAEGGFDYFNNRACLMLGYTSEELSKLKISDIAVYLTLEQHISSWKRLYKNRKYEDIIIEDKHIRKDGSIVPVEISSSFIMIEDKAFLLSYARDITERKKNEEALLKNQKLLIESQRIAKLGSWEMDLKTLKLTWNREAYQIFGYKYKEINPTVETFFHLLYPEDLDIANNHFDTTIRTKTFENFECRIIHPDKKIISIIVSGEVQLDEQKNPINMIGIVQDITDRKRATTALRKSEEKLRSILKVAPVGIGIISDRKHIKANPYICKITGYTEEELIGKSARILYPDEEEFTRAAEIYGKVHKKGICEIETLWKRKNGEIINIYMASTLVNIDDKLKEIIYTALDISVLKKIEKELIASKERAEESEYFLRESQHTANIGSIKVNLITGKWISTETLNHILGLEPEVQCNLDIYHTIIEPTYRQKFENILDRIAFAQNRTYNIQLPIIKYNNKRKIWIHAVGKIFYNAEGKPFEIIGTVQDITERKLLEKKTKQLNAELEIRVIERTAQLKQANKDLESFAYSISHDLRAPLRHIDGFLKLLNRAIGNMNDRTQNYYKKIETATIRMSVMIDELLHFSRLGRTELKTKKIDISAAISSIIEQLKPDYQGRKINWIIKELPDVYADPGLFNIALVNLISNAVKYTSKKDQAIIEIGTYVKNEEKTSIYIKDNGTGFDMAYKDKLFGVFQRLHNDKDYEGVGIGLANVKQIITKHKGTINAYSEVDKGATFYIALPNKIV